MYTQHLFMKTIISFILLATFSTLLYSAELPLPVVNKDKQGDPSVNQVDELGRKQGFWIYLGKDQPEKGYPEEGKIAEGPFKDDRRHGRWIMYYKDGVTPKTAGEYINNRPDGNYIKYHENGKIKEIGTYNKRYYTDSLKRYNEEGVLVYESEYNESGKESGTVKYYYDNGTPEFVYNVSNGVPNGKAVRYWPNGDIKEELEFGEFGEVLKTTGEIPSVNTMVEVERPKDRNAKPGPRPSNTGSDFKPNGYNKVFNSDKEIWIEGDFKGGHLYDGRLYIYDEDGLLFKVEVYKEGKYHSDGQL